MHNKAGIRRDKKMCLQDWDGNMIHICGSRMGGGLNFMRVARPRDSCLWERAGVTELVPCNTLLSTVTVVFVYNCNKAL